MAKSGLKTNVGINLVENCGKQVMCCLKELLAESNISAKGCLGEIFKKKKIEGKTPLCRMDKQGKS